MQPLLGDSLEIGLSKGSKNADPSEEMKKKMMK
jgi:hypothetical protein